MASFRVQRVGRKKKWRVYDFHAKDRSTRFFQESACFVASVSFLSLTPTSYPWPQNHSMVVVVHPRHLRLDAPETTAVTSPSHVATDYARAPQKTPRPPHRAAPYAHKNTKVLMGEGSGGGVRGLRGMIIIFSHVISVESCTTRHFGGGSREICLRWPE